MRIFSWEVTYVGNEYKRLIDQGLFVRACQLYKKNKKCGLKDAHAYCKRLRDGK